MPWPAVPGKGYEALFALLFQLESTQWLLPGTLRRQQFQQATRLLRHAMRTVPYYRTRLGDAGIPASGRITYEKWNRIPLLRRHDIQTHEADLLSTQIPRSHGKTSTVLTSGSTGRPIRAVNTGLAGLFWRAFTMRDLIWHRRDLGGKLAAIKLLRNERARTPKGRRHRNWAPSRAFPTGPGYALDITIPLERQVEWLQQVDPHYLLTYPTNALHLARLCLDEGIRLPQMREVSTLSELLTPEARVACRQAWGVKVADMYSAQEVGYMALQCPDHEHYHVQSEGVLVEVLDSKDRPCGQGQIGRVVVTGLVNFAMPLIRYDIGDLAEVGEPCTCGRGLPVLKRIIGRARSMLILPSGHKVYPIFSSSDFLSVAPVRQKQLVQRSPDEIEVVLVVEETLTGEQEARLGEALNRRIGHPFTYRFTYMDEIPRSKGGKFEEIRVDFRT